MKCFLVGMKKELILSDDQKKLKRVKKVKHDSVADQSIHSLMKVHDESKDVMSPESFMNEPDDNSPSITDCTNDSDNLFFGLRSELSNSFHLHCHSQIDKYYNLTQDKRRTEQPSTALDACVSSAGDIIPMTSYFQLEPWPETYLQRMAEAEFAIPGHYRNNAILNPLELARLTELMEAEASVEGVRSTLVDPKNPSLIDVIKVTDYAIRKFINMSKKLSGFRQLCEQDQIALLKGACAELLALGSAMAYNQENDYWADANDQAVLKMEVLKLGSKGVDLYDKNKALIDSFRSFRRDKNVMLILCAITIFTPERVNVIHTDTVK